MATRYLLIDASDTIVNVILYEPGDAYAPPDGTTLEVAPDGVGIGFARVAGVWTAPAPEPEDAP